MNRRQRRTVEIPRGTKVTAAEIVSASGIGRIDREGRVTGAVFELVDEDEELGILVVRVSSGAPRVH